METEKKYGKNRRSDAFANQGKEKKTVSNKKRSTLNEKLSNGNNDHKRAARKSFFTSKQTTSERGASRSRKPSSYHFEENEHFGDRRDSRTRKSEEKGFAKKRKDRNNGQDSEIIREIIHKRHQEGRFSERKPKVLTLAWNDEHDLIRLNKYISNSGICSRREADDLITAGAIMVNGKVVTELGTKVSPTDEVRYEDKILQREKPVYLLLNKPKDYITTTEDERDRNSVMMLVKDACPERIYPVGRLDRNTTGLLLFTNDGEMTKKLTHPKFEIKKIYQVELDRNMELKDFQTLSEGIELYDGFIKPDELAYVDGQKNILGITLHSGKNRIVRRMFGSLGYEVEKLDRVYYAGLTKKDLPRGHYRFLTQAEINMLKMSL